MEAPSPPPLLPSNAVVRRASIEVTKGAFAIGLVAVLASGLLTGVFFEALTDRDWTVRGWEWPEVLALVLVVVVATVWFVSSRARREGQTGLGVVKHVAKAQLGHLGYSVQRLPTPADDPQFALEVGFEYVLAHYLAGRIDARPFFFLQIGANDGVGDDPLREHVRSGAWQGILLEPQALPFARLLDNYADVEGLRFVNAAVAAQSGTRRLYVLQDQEGVTIDSMSGTASFRAETLRSPREKLDIPGSRIGSVEVESTTFSEVLRDVRYLDLLQIDAEGYDLELLKLFDFDRIRPAIVRFEHRHLDRLELDEAFELLACHGYRMVCEEYDTTAYAPMPNELALPGQ